MSNLVNSFLTDFKSQADVPEVFRDNVYPLVAPDGIFPVVVYQYNDGVRNAQYKGSFGLKTTSVVLNLYSLNYDELVTAREQIETIYNGYSGELSDNTLVTRITMNDAFFALEYGNDDVYRCTVEIDLET